MDQLRASLLAPLAPFEPTTRALQRTFKSAGDLTEEVHLFMEP